MGAMRPQTPHRSPRQAFGGNSLPMPHLDARMASSLQPGLSSTVMQTKPKTASRRKKAHPSEPVYAGIDLHSNNLFIALTQGDGTRLTCTKLPCDLPAVIAHLEPFKPLLRGIAIESTFNWYWLV